MRHAFPALLLLLFNSFLILNLAALTLAEKSNGVCISPGGRFAPFSIAGHPPRPASKGSNDLALCRIFRKNTCCDVTQTYPALKAVRRLASSGEASDDCLHLWELLECSICDPRVGVQPGPPLLCSSFCDMVALACSNAYFAIDVKTQVLSPCGPGDVICGRLSNWASNGTELCSFAGFSVQTDTSNYNSVDGRSCYGGKASLDSISDTWSNSRGSHVKEVHSGALEEFHQWLSGLTISEQISWAVGGMVLTAGLLFVSRRKSHSQRRKQAAVLRTARRLETRIAQPSASASSRKAS